MRAADNLAKSIMVSVSFTDEGDLHRLRDALNELDLKAPPVVQDTSLAVALKSEPEVSGFLDWLAALQADNVVQGSVDVYCGDNAEPVKLHRQLERALGHQRLIANLSVKRDVGMFAVELEKSAEE